MIVICPPSIVRARVDAYLRRATDWQPDAPTLPVQVERRRDMTATVVVKCEKCGHEVQVSAKQHAGQPTLCALCAEARQ